MLDRGYRPPRSGSIRDPKSNIPLKSVLKYLAVFLALFSAMLLVIHILEMAARSQTQPEPLPVHTPVVHQAHPAENPEQEREVSNFVQSRAAEISQWSATQFSQIRLRLTEVSQK